jgi:uncharacterized protein (TIGR02147 family)
VTRRCPIDVFRYLNFRAFLDAYYKARKKKGYSFRAFSRRVGLSSPNYLKLVIQGKRNLTPDMARRFAEACRLHGEAAEYFQKLVGFNQAKTSEERMLFYEQLRSFKRYRSAQKLEMAHAAYHSNWYLPAIRELVARDDFQDDPQWIAEQLIPPIAVREAKQALEVLIHLGLLERDEHDHLCLGTPVLTTGPETAGLHIRTYHQCMMTQAAQSMETIPATERDISSLTLCLGPSGLKTLKRRIQAFRAELIKLAESDPQPRQVVQLNFQLFPLSANPDQKKEGGVS